jgi:hypothetical protein
VSRGPLEANFQLANAGCTAGCVSCGLKAANTCRRVLRAGETVCFALERTPR